jgi:hypothetical protein
VVAALVGAPAAARAQQTQSIPDRLRPTTRVLVERLADSLRAAGLPADPLYAKAAEGVLKGADDERILGALRTLARELGEARSALGPTAGPAELIAGASALHAGVPPATLRRLREVRERKAPASSLATPLVVLADLVTRRVPPAVAASSVDQLLARGAPDDDFTALRAGIERDILAGRPPDAATVARTQALLQTIDTRRPPPVRPPD